MKSSVWLTVFLIFLFALPSAHGQKGKKEPLKHEKEVRDMVTFFQFMLNTLGDPATSARDKDVLVMESYTKIFRDGKVQVEDDLDPRRTVITNKDVTAYLKDVDFFFRDVKFELSIEDIQASGAEEKLFYKVKLTRNLKGTTVDGKAINNTMPRFIEINYNPREEDLKIVSIYTNQFNEKEALNNWWNALSYEWKSVFKVRFDLGDTVSLDDIKTMTSVDSLDLSNNVYITSIEPLAMLLDLRYLNLSRTSVTDLNPIRNLTELQELDLSDTRIEDITALRYSTNLKRLNLNATPTVDISVFEKLQALQQVGLRATKIYDFRPLRFLTALEVLNTESTVFSDLPAIDSLSQLKDLNVARTPVRNLTPLVSLTKLENLNLDSTLVEDLSALHNHTALKVLNINNTKVASLDPLIGLPQLQRIYCDRTGVNREIADAFMSAKKNVLVIFDSEDLQTWWNNLQPIWRDVLSRRAKVSLKPSKEELAKVTNIDSINLGQYISLKSIEPLARLLKLKTVIANNTGIADISPLKDLREIVTLDISNTAVADIGPLARLSKLKTLRTDYTQSKTIDTLASLKTLTRLYVDGMSIQDTTVQKFLQRNGSALVVYKTNQLNEWWSKLPDDWKQIFETQLRLGIKPSRESIHQLVELERIAFGDVPVNDLAPLLEFVRLKELKFSGTAISNIGPLAEIKTLRSLHVNDNPIHNLSPIRGLRELDDLDFSNTPVEELEVVASLRNLKKLNCSGTQIRKLKELENLKALEYLDCSNTDVKSLDDLKDVPLKTLKCYNTKISKGEVEKFKKHHPDCNVSYYR
jgi:Leucine-rich repeat (LRR) protein